MGEVFLATIVTQTTSCRIPTSKEFVCLDVIEISHRNSSLRWWRAAQCPRKAGLCWTSKKAFYDHAFCPIFPMNVFLIFEFLFPAILYDFCHSKNGSKIDEKITLKSNLNLQIFGLHLQIVYSHVMSGLVVEPKTR